MDLESHVKDKSLSRRTLDNARKPSLCLISEDFLLAIKMLAHGFVFIVYIVIRHWYTRLTNDLVTYTYE